MWIYIFAIAKRHIIFFHTGFCASACREGFLIERCTRFAREAPATKTLIMITKTTKATIAQQAPANKTFKQALIRMDRIDHDNQDNRIHHLRPWVNIGGIAT